ncbi:hypothetical protein A0H81_04959 [Grifola frondosa]|uniref:MYND-type domain-containing protein n=1 Tax=Grifola frondosa TaxID=5627 RepID=A0A1C7MED2_GRIFR|nr:hypothetical protein A0H81_04959 [Grifola frondosa]
MLSPQPSMEGSLLPPNYFLPSIELVRAEAEQWRTLSNTGPGRLPKLFEWSCFVRVQDVSDELLEPVIFGLENTLDALFNHSNEKLLEFKIFQPGDDTMQKWYRLCINCLYKVQRHLYDPQIDRPAQAAMHLKTLIFLHAAPLSSQIQEPWMLIPDIYCSYADALVGTGIFTTETKVTLERVLQAIEASPEENNKVMKLRARANLSLVLDQLDVERDAQIAHTKWVANFLRRNPTAIDNSYLRLLLARPNFPPHPVLNALGTDWIENRKLTARALGLEKKCHVCRIHGVHKTLFRCSRCGCVNYCSPECQKVDWKYHKLSCSKISEFKREVQQLKDTDPEAAQMALDWSKWHDRSYNHIGHAYMHALGLKRDPSRGRTHVVVSEVEYTPHASKDPRFKFRIVRCGVFRLADMASTDLNRTRISDREKRSLRALAGGVRDMFDRVDNSNLREVDAVSMVDFTFGVEISGSNLMCRAIDRVTVEQLPYNSYWRKMLNKGPPPKPFTDFASLRDVEHVF